MSDSLTYRRNRSRLAILSADTMWLKHSRIPLCGFI